MKLTWDKAAGVLRLDADVAEPADLQFLEHLYMQHAPESAGLAALARAATAWRRTPCAEPLGDQPGVYYCVGAGGWTVLTGVDLPLASLWYRSPPAAPGRSRADAAARLGHALLDALELLGRDPN